MKVLGLIPARSGSKGVPGKNTRMLCGKPLLQYTAEAALDARLLSRLILSTESEEIAAVGRSCGLEVPFMRPLELAEDDTPMLPVVQHALRWIESQGERFDAVCLLQPTNPLRRSEDIDACIELLDTTGADAVVTIKAVPPEHNPHWVYFQNGSDFLRLSTGEDAPVSRRQDLPPAFHREGSVYVTRRDVLMETNSLYGKRLAGHLIEAESTVNIDSLQDWTRAEKLLAVIQ
ncbi:MAG: acylneuraminate cytidylyltransferase family protein [Pyrinomonadaceae bacterium]|nr:acylneuraminate cytidylyltransferase family protein [Pyrinomonadaceae bacterium]